MSADHKKLRVFADTNVLYASRLRDILIELAIVGSIELRWSSAVLDELIRVLTRLRADFTEAKALGLIAAMTEALPDALVIVPEGLEPIGLPDAGDEHVVAAAVHGGCNVLLTFNVKDFPGDLVGPIPVRHPDTFLLEQVAADPATVIGVVDRIRRQLTSPPIDTTTYCDGFARAGLPQTAELMRHLLPV